MSPYFAYINIFVFLSNTVKLNLFVVSVVVTIIPLLGGVAIFTLAERKVMATIQRRRGPNVVGFWGLLQPFADGLKLIIKEIIVPAKADRIPFLMAPAVSFVLSILGWSLIPLYGDLSVRSASLFNPNLGVLFVFAISSLGAYGVLIGGWASNSKYALLGALRSAAQMISYEVSLGLSVLPIFICSGTLNLSEIVEKQINIWYCFPLFPLMIIFLISLLAETNRAPFDLPEAEAELVAGFNVEYSGVIFALFFLAEYSSMLFMGVLAVLLFLGGWNNFILLSLPPVFNFFFKSVFFFFMYIFVRANFPRLRYDQLMNICWKVFLPLTLGYVVFISCFFVQPIIIKTPLFQMLVDQQVVMLFRAPLKFLYTWGYVFLK